MNLAAFRLLIALFLIFNRHGSASEEEIRSLLEFKKGIKVDNSNRIVSTWIFPPDVSTCPVDFHGIACDQSAMSVVAIALDGLGLVGELKFSTLLPLKFLQNLTLAGNMLSGRIVPTLGTMYALQVIDLSRNQFYGPIPSRLTKMSGLRYINLSVNNFTGGFPRGIGNLQQLRVLDLHSNHLRGDVGELIPELRNVEYLDLSGNQFYGSIELSVEKVNGLANNAKYVNMSGNELGGRFWGRDVMTLFRNLQVLDLGNSGLVGTFEDFGQLPNLQVLRLGNNRLSGSVPEGILQGEVPLVELDLSGNEFSGAIPVINSTSLTTLNLSSNSISGSLPPSVGRCRIVDLSRNLFSDEISVLVTWNDELEILDLSSNGLTGNIPNLTQFQRLTLLSLQNNTLEGSMPSALGSLSKLRTVDLSSNRLDGPIPDSIFTSTTLTNLNFSANLLDGAIPLGGPHDSERLVLSSGRPMERLDLSDNMLTGELPSDIGNWGRLKLLNLACNDLSSQLPKELSKLGRLEYLNLSHNHFSGNIPDKLPLSLKILDVSYNKLSGIIPENLIYIPDLSFSGNNLEPDLVPPSNNLLPPHIDSRSRFSFRIAIIVASVGAAVMIALVIIAYHRARFHHVQRGFVAQTVDNRDVGVRECHPPLFKSHRSSPEHHPTANDNLLTSSSRLMSGRVDREIEVFGTVLPEKMVTGAASVNFKQQDDLATTSRRKSSPESPISTSPRLPKSLEPVSVDTYSPDRLVGELFFLDTSLVFTSTELSRAPAEVLGRSSHGTLYKATLADGNSLTVKWLRIGLVKEKKEFAKEVKRIGSIRHQNIASLRAYYWGPREQERLILADYIPGDSLALHLYETTPRRHSPLSFHQRLKVALDVARGLVFLHNKGLPHGNLKPTNIILTAPEYNVHLTNYSLHRLMTSAAIAEQILNLGAHGYRAPELATASKPTPSFKADVYAFGVIIMELLTRRSAGDIISGQSGAVDLTDWVRLCDREGRRIDCIDRYIGGGEEYMEAMDYMLGVSLRCILPVNERPNMRQVFQDICAIYDM